MEQLASSVNLVPHGPDVGFRLVPSKSRVVPARLLSAEVRTVASMEAFMPQPRWPRQRSDVGQDTLKEGQAVVLPAPKPVDAAVHDPVLRKRALVAAPHQARWMTGPAAGLSSDEDRQEGLRLAHLVPAPDEIKCADAALEVREWQEGLHTSLHLTSHHRFCSPPTGASRSSAGSSCPQRTRTWPRLQAGTG